MISKEDVKKLAGLARLGLTEMEMERFPGEIEAILGYVGKVKEAAEAAPKPEYPRVNVFREDEVTHTSGEYSSALLKAAPSHEGSYVKVKKILE